MPARVTSLAVAIAVLSIVALSGQTPGPSATPLKNQVRLVTADDANETIAVNVTANASVPLRFRNFKVEKDGTPLDLTVTGFSAQTPASGETLSGRLKSGGKDADPSGRLQLATSMTWWDVDLTIDGLKPGATYKGWLVLSSADQMHRWTMTAAAQGAPGLQVQPVGPMKLVVGCLWPFGSCDVPARRFAITLSNPSSQRVRNVRARLEPPTGAPGKTITSNLGIDAFAFSDDRRALDLASAGAAAASPERETFFIPPHDQSTITATVGRLRPGDYSATLTFFSAETGVEGANARLPLVIQIRHHWIFPVLVILFGSAAGWYGSKYVVAARKARQVSAQLAESQERADLLLRASPPGPGWHFPAEATSYGLARARVALHQLSKLTGSAFSMLIWESDIDGRRQDIERRLTGLEQLRNVRLRVEHAAADRPAAEISVGRLLRRAADALDGTSFRDAEQTKATEALALAEAWLKDQGLDEKQYGPSICQRRLSREIPDDQERDGLPADSAVRKQLAMLTLPTAAEIEAAVKDPDLRKLSQYDRVVAEVALLWRERALPWASALAERSRSKATLEELFEAVDQAVWSQLTASASANLLSVTRPAGGSDTVETHTLVEFALECRDPILSEWRLRFHPLRVRWRITPPSGSPRTMETNGLKCLQYFPSAGLATVEASLVWKGDPVAIPGKATVTIAANPKGGVFAAAWRLTELGAIGLAVGFSIATGIVGLYDATFGSFNQYLTLFLWSAGAGTGGNLFNQLGTSGVVGGRADAALSK